MDGKSMRNWHIENLDRLFPSAKRHGAALLRSLRCYECKLHRLAEKECSDSNWSSRDEREVVRLEQAVRRLLNTDLPLVFNSDPRGYMLKLSDKYVRENRLDIHRDWGGYGILAPAPDQR